MSSKLDRTVTANDICGVCGNSNISSICNSGQMFVCRKCLKQICNVQLCSESKTRKHSFQELTKISQQRSPDFGTLGSKPIVNVIEDMTEREEEATFSKQQVSSPSVEEKEWHCRWCTYLNSSRHSICVMCGATRGVGDVEQSKPSTIVCRNGTFHNEQDATVRVARLSTNQKRLCRKVCSTVQEKGRRNYWM